MNIVTYIFWPNPGNTSYDNPKVMLALLVGVGLIIISIGLRFWRKRHSNAITKRLGRSWRNACLWFGIVALMWTVSRVEMISYLSMRLWWIVWVAAIAAYVWFQLKSFKAKHYETLPSEIADDPRGKYLPRKKKR